MVSISAILKITFLLFKIANAFGKHVKNYIFYQIFVMQNNDFGLNSYLFK
jgi:hypothetical protein